MSDTYDANYDGDYEPGYAPEPPDCADLITSKAFVDQVTATTHIQRRKVIQVLAAAAALLDAQ